MHKPTHKDHDHYCDIAIMEKIVMKLDEVLKATGDSCHHIEKIKEAFVHKDLRTIEHCLGHLEAIERREEAVLEEIKDCAEHVIALLRIEDKCEEKYLGHSSGNPGRHYGR